MFGRDIGFGNPFFLLLLLFLPVLWIWSFRRLAGLGPYRRLFALLFRTLVFVLLVLALANTQLRRTSETLTVIYLLDQSASIPAEQREAMVEVVLKDVQRHRQRKHDDKASVIVFGREASIEVQPINDDLPIFGRLESMANVRRDATDVSAAMKLAQATFPEGTARRVVIVSDGNENLGDAHGIARQLVDDGVGIDVVPVELTKSNEVSVERVVLPNTIRKDEPFEARVVLDNATDDILGGNTPEQSDPTEGDDPEGDGVVHGTVRLVHRRGGREEVLIEEKVALPPGKTFLKFEHQIDEPDFYEYQAIFTADDPTQDLITQNNRATSFTHVQGKGHVLVIEDWENRDSAGDGESAELVRRLRAMNIEVNVQFTDELFASLAELQRFDSIIMVNTPRSSGSTADNLKNFSDSQIDALVANTQQMGCGLVMIGGQNAFGAGGWANTPLEKAMPVDFRIRNAKIKAVGALVMMMHASEMAEGNHWQKVIAREGLNALGPQDYCGVIHWDASTFMEGWLWGKPQGLIQVGTKRDRMVSRLDQMAPGDMPEFEPALRLSIAGFNSVSKAATKHMIIISDGDPSPPRTTTLARLKRMGVQITTVAVGTHGAPGSWPLERISAFTGGKYYVVRDPNALPRIYQREARKVARPVLVERELMPQIVAPHEILNGIDALPPTRGFVMTQIKENPLAEVAVISPFPADRDNATLLAAWQYGLGRTAVLTTDSGHRWAEQWTGWDQYDKFFSQLVRWSMRPTGQTGNFNVTTNLKDGKVQVVVDALDKNDEFLNFLNLSATAVDPSMETKALTLRQTAPGRYLGELEADKSGSYFLTIAPGAGQSPIRIGINVPYSAEYRDRETNHAKLMALARLTPKGGEPGRLLASSVDELNQHFEDNDVGPAESGFSSSATAWRRTLASAVSSDYAWPWLALLTACVFFGDVLIRRVAISFDWVRPTLAGAANWVTRREGPEAPDTRIERLRSRKAAIDDAIDRHKAASRFELTDIDAHEASLDVLDEPTRQTDPRPTETTEIAPANEEEDYTERLLRAKQKAREDMEGK